MPRKRRSPLVLSGENNFYPIASEGTKLEMQNRDPGDKVKEALRQEVNFGCPVRFEDGTGCGSPVLTYHHFDPPWAGNFVHDPAGMIALCPLHHNQADGGCWTNLQLREMKANPFVDDKLKIQWPWQTEKLVMKVGKSLVIENGSALRFRGRQVMGFFPQTIKTLGASTISFNSEIMDRKGNLWLKIQKGWFDLDIKSTQNLLFTPHLKQFSAENSDSTLLNLKFKRVRAEAFREYLNGFIDKPDMVESASQSILFKKKLIDSDGFVPLMEIEGKFESPEMSVTIKGDKMRMEVFIKGMEDEFEWHSWVVNGVNRAIFSDVNKKEFFSLG